MKRYEPFCCAQRVTSERHQTHSSRSDTVHLGLLVGVRVGTGVMLGRTGVLVMVGRGTGVQVAVGGGIVVGGGFVAVGLLGGGFVAVGLLGDDGLVG